jgi:APA family basic amino acid/polyamine antiporter
VRHIAIVSKTNGKIMSALNKTLGLPMLIFYGTGMILGAGIYSIIGKAAAVTGGTLWIGFAFASVAAFLTALSYAELTTMFPKAGAEFIYLRETFKTEKWIGSTAGIAMAFSGAATAATVALAFSGYLNQFINSPQITTAMALLIIFSGIAIMGIRTSGWITIISTLIEISGLILIIYFGLTSNKFGNSLETVPHLGTMSGSALIIFSFFGFENIANLAEEAKNPEKDLPRAILISVIIATILYILVSISALSLLSSEKLANSDAPLMDVAKTASITYSKILGAVALFSTANTALISLIGASRILYSMGEAKVLPKLVAVVSLKRKTPWIASIIVLITASILLPLGNLETIASVSSLTTMIAFLLVNIALIVLRYKQSTKIRAFKVPLSIGKTPIFPILAAFICLLLLTQFHLKVYLIGIGFLALSSLYFWLHERNHK